MSELDVGLLELHARHTTRLGAPADSLAQRQEKLGPRWHGTGGGTKPIVGELLLSERCSMALGYTRTSLRHLLRWVEAGAADRGGHCSGRNPEL
jgi:hypothetical protein